ncbi:unnamed protein product [Fraxinus pennsylvanica]|uniref:HMA domain-containing protein n=1 Tax=Fraxinus pennsylvanica TaxID=56036 RepID=A0AAD1ZFS9_9LAMI|nr:unnamed protein product [Fraxinus pennsylvanica]
MEMRGVTPAEMGGVARQRSNTTIHNSVGGEGWATSGDGDGEKGGDERGRGSQRERRGGWGEERKREGDGEKEWGRIRKNKKNNEADQKNENDNNKKKDNGGNDNITAVLKAGLHCDGCASKFLKCIRSFDGVKALTIDESQKITVTGKFDPVKLREKVEDKTHKKVELISPGQPKKKDNDKENAKGKENGKEDKNTKIKSEDKKCKNKEQAVMTAVLKVQLHCQGCIQKIHKIVTKTKGYEGLKIDRQKDLVTVTGAMDMKALAESLKKHLKKEVEILPPKKEGGGGGDKGKGGGDDKAKGGSKEGGGGDKGKDGGSSKEEGGGEKKEELVQIWNPYPCMYGPGQMGEQFQYHPYGYGPNHAPQIFSDENPNACSFM